jgi:hypothetical protein
VESVENQTQVFHASHRPLKIPQNRRDFHISTARACTAWKSGKPKTGFPLSHPGARDDNDDSLSQTENKERKSALRGLLIFSRLPQGTLRYRELSCSSFDWKMLAHGEAVSGFYGFGENLLRTGHGVA